MLLSQPREPWRHEKGAQAVRHADANRAEDPDLALRNAVVNGSRRPFHTFGHLQQNLAFVGERIAVWPRIEELCAEFPFQRADMAPNRVVIDTQ